MYEAIEDAAGQAPAHILDNLRANNSGTTVQIRDVYNASARIRKRKLGKYTPIQALLKSLHRNNWFVKFILDPDSKQVSSDTELRVIQ